MSFINESNGFGYDYGRQIYCDRRQKTSMTFLNRLLLAPISNWCELHATGQKGQDNRKKYSLIKLQAQDYSNGTGQKSLYVSYNFSPADIRNLKAVVNFRYNEYQRRFYKVISQTGTSPFTECKITRNPQMNNPWMIEITNGTAENGKPIPSTAVTVKQFFSEELFFDMITTVERFITLWEDTFASKLLQKGHTESKKVIVEYSTSQQNTQQQYASGGGLPYSTGYKGG